jgi:dihydroneopterin aldolase
MTQSATLSVYPTPETATSLVRILISDLVLLANLGVHPHEQGRQQRVRINVELMAHENRSANDQLQDVVCYESIVDSIKAIVASGHVNLVETLAAQIADSCLEDPRIVSAKVRVEKPDAIREAAMVGIEIERKRY